MSITRSSAAWSSGRIGRTPPGPLISCVGVRLIIGRAPGGSSWRARVVLSSRCQVSASGGDRRGAVDPDLIGSAQLLGPLLERGGCLLGLGAGGNLGEHLAPHELREGVGLVSREERRVLGHAAEAACDRLGGEEVLIRESIDGLAPDA